MQCTCAGSPRRMVRFSWASRFPHSLYSHSSSPPLLFTTQSFCLCFNLCNFILNALVFSSTHLLIFPICLFYWATVPTTFITRHTVTALTCRSFTPEYCTIPTRIAIYSTSLIIDNWKTRILPALWIPVPLSASVSLLVDHQNSV
jgi:hypothetical protein